MVLARSSQLISPVAVAAILAVGTSKPPLTMTPAATFTSTAASAATERGAPRDEATAGEAGATEPPAEA